MDKATVQAALTRASLANLVNHLDVLARPSIRLRATPAEEAKIQPGSTRIGGQPDLPQGFKWPQWNGLPQAFIAQIRLDEAQTYDPEHILPTRGMLWFFYDAQQETYGDSQKDRGAWQVFFSEDLSKLQRTSLPKNLPRTAQFSACSVSFSNEITLSQQPNLELPDMQWSSDDQEKYDTLLQDLSSQQDTTPPRHRLLGHPDTIQDDMRLQCEMATHGIDNADDPKVKELEKTANDWHLLLQIDTDERIGMRWASSGMLYYWIRLDDLKARKLDQVWLVLQSE